MSHLHSTVSHRSVAQWSVPAPILSTSLPLHALASRLCGRPIKSEAKLFSGSFDLHHTKHPGRKRSPGRGRRRGELGRILSERNAAQDLSV